MRRNPLYSFRDRAAVGIFNVPLHSTIHILDGGEGIPIFVEIIGKEGLSVNSTIGQFLDLPALYVDLTNSNPTPSELQKLQEGSNVGWRILGRQDENYADIGSGAIDFSSNTSVDDMGGASGTTSFATGLNTSASGENSFVAGIGTAASTFSSAAVGSFNEDTGAIFTVGVGADSNNRKNALEVNTDGTILAPECDLVEVQNGDAKTLVTKEYSDDIDGGSI